MFLSLSFLYIVFTEGPPSYSISIWVCFFTKKKMSFSIEKFKILPKFCLNWNTFSYINTEVKKKLRFLIIQYSLSMIYYIQWMNLSKINRNNNVYVSFTSSTLMHFPIFNDILVTTGLPLIDILLLAYNQFLLCFEFIITYHRDNCLICLSSYSQQQQYF